jgi:hypothetical protein
LTTDLYFLLCVHAHVGELQVGQHAVAPLEHSRGCWPFLSLSLKKNKEEKNATDHPEPQLSNTAAVELSKHQVSYWSAAITEPSEFREGK